LKVEGKQEEDEQEQIALTQHPTGGIVHHIIVVMMEVATLETAEVAIKRRGKHLPILESQVDAFFLFKLTYMIPLHN